MRKISTLLMLFCAFVGSAWAQLVQTSTAESPIYYVIASYNRGGVITYDAVGGAIQHKAATNDGKCEWYFEAVPGNTDGGVYVVNKCKDGENKLYLGADKKVSTTPAVWYVLANGVNNEGVSISSTATISGSNCLDASNSNSGIGGWAPNAGDWQGTTWVLFADMENAKYNPNKYINQQGQGGRSISSITINGVTKTTSTYGLAYADHTSRVEFKVVTGSDVEISIARNGGWMHAFAYVDVAGDGFATEGVDTDGYTPTGDLVSYSCYDADNNEVGVNSAGTELSGGARNTVALPNFTAPATVGKYRLRVKYDWNDLDPNTGEQFITAGSQFVDVILNVVENPLAPILPLAETLYASVKDNAGSAIGEYPADKVNALAAAIEVAKAIADDAATAEDAATLQAAMDAVKVILPVPGQYYQFHSALTKYAENQPGVVKAVYSDGSNVRWATLNGEDKSFFWKAVVASDGNIVFQNAGDEKYMVGKSGDSEVWTMAENYTDASKLSVKIFSKEENAKGYEYGVVLNSKQMHTAGHGEGKGVSGNIVSWNTDAANSASSWYIVPTELPTFYTVTYNFVYNEEVKFTQTANIAAGGAYPEVSVPVLPYGVTVSATKPEGTVNANSTTDFALTVAKEFPYKTSADVNNITTWYYAKMHANTNVTAYLEDTNEGADVEWKDKTVAESEIDSHLWGFVGDVWNGIKVVNKATGRAIVSTSGAAALGEKANATAFIPVLSNGNIESDWFCLKYPTSNYLNASGEKVGSWGDADNGSSLFLVEYKETAVEVTEAGYATLFLGQATYIPEGVEVYTVTAAHDGWVETTLVEDVLPANCGVILKNAGNYTFKTAGATGTAEGNLLLGTTTNTYVEGAAYVLGKDGEGAGLFKAALNKNEAGEEGTTHFLNNANKAYLPASAVTTLAATLRFNFGGTTAIESVLNNGIDANAAIYDLSGRRVEKAVKGIYIQNGKKIIVK